MKPVLILFLFISVTLSAQNSSVRAPHKSTSKFQLGINISPAGFFQANLNPYTTNESDYEEYEPVYTVKSHISFGISSLYKINRFISIGPGISYSKMHVERQFHVYEPESQNASLLEIPFILRFEFLKYFYASQGLLLHFELNENEIGSSQNGAGYLVSLGFNYNFQTGFSIFGGPAYKAYSLLPIHATEGWKVIMRGVEINFGVLLSL